jgi:hypothetical protein
MEIKIDKWNLDFLNRIILYRTYLQILMFGAKNSDSNDSLLQKDDLQTYLSNRRHLDLALKLALGS